ncbi:MAG: hypothetical protein SFV53_02800 [Rickettsiales bacterium]|nr:hypothetical protein [Rickettsiales bacterium]
MTTKKIAEKKCGESCGCEANDDKKILEENLEIKAGEESKEENKTFPEKRLDPTYFGDWQVNCRAIDF